MTSNYPSSFDNWSDLADNTDYPMASYINDLHSWIITLENILGINPQGASPTVAARLDTLTPV